MLHNGSLPFWEMNTTPPLESLAARAWGMRVYTASPPASPQYHLPAGLSVRGIRCAFSELDAGVFMIEIRAVGFAPGTGRAPLKPHQVLAYHFELERLPYELPEVVVKGKGPLSVRRFADFERRRESGLGAFLTQERIERANTASLVDVLATVRGVQQVCISNQCVAKMVRSPPGCYPQYYLDGNESSSYFARLTPPQDVKGVEIYRGSSETRGEVQGCNSGCGVIAIWTKSAP